MAFHRDSPSAAGELFDTTLEGFQLLRGDFNRSTTSTHKCKAKVFAALGYRYLTLRQSFAFWRNA